LTAGLYALLGNTTTTTGTGPYSLSGTLPAPFRSIASVLTDGQQFFGCCRDNVNFESAIYQFNAAGPTVSRIMILDSSAGGPGVPVNWSSGTRNLFCDAPGRAGVMFGSNNLAEITSPVTARTNLGVTFGTAAGNVPQLDGSARLPAVDGSLLTALPLILTAPSGTKIALYRETVPAGWALITSIFDSVISITKGSGVGGATGGTSDSGAIGGWASTALVAHALTAAEIPIVTGGPSAVGGGGGSSAPQTAAAHSHGWNNAWRPPQSYFCIFQKT
jgi:hypothetical protein